MKIFISQPMGGKSHEEIDSERQRVIQYLKDTYGETTEVLDTNLYFPHKGPLYYLAKSLEYLDQADIAYFMKDWENYRGCFIEHECCKHYNIPVIYET